MAGELVRPLVANVNDGAAARYVITRMLTRAGFEVLEIDSGEEALEIAYRRRPDVMILDVKLPGIDGMEVCRRLKSDPETASMAILQTSATFVSLEAKVHGLETGADAFLVQPFTAQELVATVRSLLRLKDRETAQIRRAEALAEADRRKDEFLAMLAHELRNPLAAVTTALAVLDRYAPADRIEDRARDIARRQTAQLGRLVDDLLDVSRVMRGIITLHRENVDVGQLLASATGLAEDVKLRTRERNLALSLPPRPVFVDGDRMRLLQVFSNVIDNAIKYTRKGGNVTVSLAEENGRARVRVRDDGMGIPVDALASVFDLFFQAQTTIARSSGGLGIGLTLVKNLTELHGGQVALRSDGVGRGTEVEIDLPSVVQEAAAMSSQPAGRGGARPRRVLIVEDNSDARDVLADLCTLWGHEVVLAADGLEGVAAALERQPDVAFIDIGLPGIDGCEVARRVRADPRGDRVRLVALTGYGSAQQRADAAAAGFDLHITKPADPEQLAEVISAGRRRGSGDGAAPSAASS